MYNVRRKEDNMSDEIKQVNEELEQFLEEDCHEDLQSLVEMVDLSKNLTNLPVIVWVDGPRNVPHGDRIKFANDYTNKLTGVELIPMKINDGKVPEKLQHKVKIKNKDVDLVSQWLSLNAELILKYMHGDVNTEDFLKGIQKV